MPVADTEVLFALSPRDPKHQDTLKLLGKLKDLSAPDTAILEFQMVLRARGRTPSEVKMAMLAMHEALTRHNVKEDKTIDTTLLILQSDLEEKYQLNYFDSLIAASTLTLDSQVISNDKTFDKTPTSKEYLYLSGRLLLTTYTRAKETQTVTDLPSSQINLT